MAGSGRGRHGAEAPLQCHQSQRQPGLGSSTGRCQQGAPRATCQQAQGKTHLAKSFPSSSASCHLKSSHLGGTSVPHMSPLAVLTPPLLPWSNYSLTTGICQPVAKAGGPESTVWTVRGVEVVAPAPLRRQRAPEPTIWSHPLLYRRGSWGQPVQAPLTSSQQQGLVKPDSQISALIPPTAPPSPSFLFFFLATWHGDLVPQPWLPCSSDGKESACNLRDLSSIPELERSSGERNGNPLQYSCLQNPMDRGSWQATELDTTERLMLLIRDQNGAPWNGGKES